MKFVNNKGVVEHIKLNGIWDSVEPGKTVDLPENIGINLGLTKVKGKSEEQPIDVPTDPADTPVDDEDEDESEDEDAEEASEEPLTADDLKKLTKDGLNDYAAKIGLEEVSESMKKDDMIKEIIKYQKANK